MKAEITTTSISLGINWVVTFWLIYKIRNLNQRGSGE